MPSGEDRALLLRLEAAKQLKAQRAGGWKKFKVLHACGTARALEVTFKRANVKFFARLLDGEIVELEAFTKAGKK